MRIIYGVIVALPLTFAIFFQHASQQYLYFKGKVSQKQQQGVLEIFKKLDYGVVLLRGPIAPEAEQTDAFTADDILYCNNAFLDIVQNRDAVIGANISQFKVKVEPQSPLP